MGSLGTSNTTLQTTNSHALAFRCDADYWVAARCLRRTARRLVRPHGFSQPPRPAEPSADDLRRLWSDWRLSLPPTRPAGAPALWWHAPGSGCQAENVAGGAGSGCQEVCTALPWGRFGFAGLGGTHERPRAPFTAMGGQLTRPHGAYGPLRAPSAGWPQIRPDWPYHCCCAGYRWRTMVLTTAAVPGCLCPTQVSFLACMRQASASNSSDSVLFPLL
jgi:hypothetical protein